MVNFVPFVIFTPKLKHKKKHVLSSDFPGQLQVHNAKTHLPSLTIMLILS